jgi:hypothetical protein
VSQESCLVDGIIIPSRGSNEELSGKTAFAHFGAFPSSINKSKRLTKWRLDSHTCLCPSGGPSKEKATLLGNFPRVLLSVMQSGR